VKNACPRCGQVFSVTAANAGQQFACTSCQLPLVVTARGIESSVPTAPPPPPVKAPPNDFGKLNEEEEEDDRPIRSRPRKNSEESGFMGFITFRYMLTPILIQVFFWAGTLLCLFLGGLSFIQGIRSMSTHEEATVRPEYEERMPGYTKRVNDTNRAVDRVVGFAFFLNGFAIAFLGPVVLRIGCELAIVYFRIHDEVRDMHMSIRKKL